MRRRVRFLDAVAAALIDYPPNPLQNCSSFVNSCHYIIRLFKTILLRGALRCRGAFTVNTERATLATLCRYVSWPAPGSDSVESMELVLLPSLDMPILGITQKAQAAGQTCSSEIRLNVGALPSLRFGGLNPVHALLEVHFRLCAMGFSTMSGKPDSTSASELGRPGTARPSVHFTLSLLAEMRDFLIATVITQKRAIATVVCQFFLSSADSMCGGGVRPIFHASTLILPTRERMIKNA